VKKAILKICVLSILLVFSFIGCDNFSFFDKSVKKNPKNDLERPFVNGIIIAKVNGYPITLEDLDEEIERYNAEIPLEQQESKITTSEEKLNYLKNELVQRVLLYKEALNRGLDRMPEVRKVIEKTKMQMLVFQLMQEEMEKISVSFGEIEEYYNKLPDEYKKEAEQRRVKEIVVKSQSQAKDLLIKLLQGNDFSFLAQQYSIVDSAKNGGDLGIIKPGDKSKEFDEIVFSEMLDVGQASNFFKGPEGYYIVKIESKLGGKRRTLSDMRDDLKTLLTISKRQKMINDLVGNLSRNSVIEIEADRI